MADIKAIATAEAPAALGAYSQAVTANGFIFVSGQLGLNPATGELAGADAASQAQQALANIQSILDEAGSSVNQLVKVTIYLSDVIDFAAVNEVYADWIGVIKPARVAIGGNQIPTGALVEIDAIATL